jgi:hypothetical protein
LSWFASKLPRNDPRGTRAPERQQQQHQEAGEKLFKMGWRKGRFVKDPDTKSSQKKGDVDASKTRTRNPAANKRERGKSKVLLADNDQSESEQEIVLATTTTGLVELDDIPEQEIVIATTITGLVELLDDIPLPLGVTARPRTMMKRRPSAPNPNPNPNHIRPCA